MTLVAMEFCWLGALMLAMGVPEAALALPAGFVAAAATRRLSGRTGWLVCAAVLVAALAALAWRVPPAAPGGTLRELMLSPGYKAFLVTTAGLGFGWIRGWMLAGRMPGLGEVATSLQAGLVLVMAAAVFAPAGEAMHALVVAFVACALLALWRARTAAARTDLALAGIVLVLAGGIGLAGAVDQTVLEPILAIPAWLWQELTQSLRALTELVPEAPEATQQPAVQAAPRPDTQVAPSWLGPFFAFLRAHEVLLGVIVYGALALGVLWAVSRYRRRRQAHVARPARIIKGRASGGFRAALVSAWRALLARLGRMRHRQGARSGMRQLYQRAVRRLAVKGWRRAPHETAEEFMARLLPAWPGEPRLLETLTAGFVADRYGAARVDPAVDWPELRRALRKVRRAHGR